MTLMYDVLNVEVSVSATLVFFFSSRRRHTRLQGDWSSDVCSSDLQKVLALFTKKPASPKQVFKPEPLPHPNFTLDQNLEVNLFAENPDLAKPIEIDRKSVV